MFAVHLAVTLLTALVCAAASVANLTGHRYPKAQADQLGVPHAWIPALGVLLGAGAAGLLAGFAVPVLGVLAASGLVLYFLGALVAHLRVRDTHLGPWSFFFGLALASVLTHLIRLT